MVLRRVSGTPYDCVPFLEHVQSVVSGLAIGVSDVQVEKTTDGNVAVSYFWAGHMLPALRNAYLVRFGLARVGD